MTNVIDRAGSLFEKELPQVNGVHVASEAGTSANELHTNEAFSEKWVVQDKAVDDQEPWQRAQFDWYLRCYGFESEQEFSDFLRSRSTILDAGCGPGYKAAWFAKLNPEATVVAMDLSESIFAAARTYQHVPNMIFVKGDIASTPFRAGAFDLVSCDQVLHHTDSPPRTVAEFERILSPEGILNTYVYARKALPRELLDEHFREYSKALSSQELWDLSDQLTQLGKTLSELKIEIDVPDMPALAIKGGRMDLQRFIYWNFIKCFWNPQHGYEASKMINFDWYAPSTAFRYTMEEFEEMLKGAGFAPDFLHSEEACHTGRFHK
jgi:ubiquinone/menaquinone biosynthesis C-methylase UbiE